MEKMKPSISVILPVFNGAFYLNEAISSILQQSYQDFELIIINDGSTDDSGSIIEKYLTHDRRIRYFEKKVNSGLIDSLNFGISHAKGEYIARMDADDISLSNRLAFQKKFLDDHQQMGVIGSNVHFINSSGKRISNFINNRTLPKTAQQISWTMCFTNCLIHPTVMFRRELIEREGGYSLSSLHAEDYDLWTRLLKVTHFYNLPQKLLLLRKHDKNVTVVHFDTTVSNSRRISSDYISSILNLHTSDELVNLLWSAFPLNEQESSLLVGLFQDLYSKFIELYLISTEDKNYIEKDIAHRIIELACRSQTSNDVQRFLYDEAKKIQKNEVIKFLLLHFLRERWKQLKHV